jgi:hypothetical protein
MDTKNYCHNFMTTSLLVFVMILGSIPAKSLARRNTVKGCDFSDNDNWLKQMSGYPSKNPEKTLYNQLPYRASAGAFIIIMKNKKLCYMDDNGNPKDKARAVKQFSQL